MALVGTVWAMSCKGSKFNKAAAAIRGQGGLVSPTIHRKVDFMVSSEEAVRGVTQRTKKAHRFDIPMVSLEFPHACVKNLEVIDHTPYIFNFDPGRVETTPKRKRTSLSSEDQAIAAVQSEKRQRIAKENEWKRHAVDLGFVGDEHAVFDDDDTATPVKRKQGGKVNCATSNIANFRVGQHIETPLWGVVMGIMPDAVGAKSGPGVLELRTDREDALCSGPSADEPKTPASIAKEKKRKESVWLKGKALYTAASAGDASAVKICLGVPGTNVQWTNPKDGHMSSLVGTCMYGHQTCARLLIEAGADVNFLSDWGVSSLIQACCMGHAEVSRSMYNNSNNNSRSMYGT
jgi:hypothetical protein